MNERLSVIIPCSRPWNIPLIWHHYTTQQEPHVFELRFHFLLENREHGDPKGVFKLNEGLLQVPDGWLIVPADDTLQHPSLFRRLGEVITEHPDCGAVVFSQQRGKDPGHVIHANKDTVIPGRICGGQICWKRSFIGDNRWNFDVHREGADGYFAKMMHDQAPDKFVFIDEVLMYFDSLFWR
jgi:hypothetical protein